MAEKKPEAPAEGDGAAPKSKKKLMMFIIIGVVVLVLIIGGVVGYLMLKKKTVDAEDPDAEPATEQTEKAKTKKKDNHLNNSVPMLRCGGIKMEAEKAIHSGDFFVCMHCIA